MSDRPRRDGRFETLAAPARRRPVPVLLCIGLITGAGYAIAGPGYVLDDWFTLRNAEFDGVLNTSGQHAARPGAWLAFVVLFGLVGQSPFVALAIQTLVYTAALVSLYLLIRHLMSDTRALQLTVLWAALPNHTSIERWASSIQAVAALGLVLTGLRLACTDSRLGARAAGVACLAGAGLFYEASIAASAAGVCLIPFLLRGRIDWRLVGASAAALSATLLWMITHSVHGEGGFTRRFADVSQVVPGHFGVGIAPDGLAASLMTVAILGFVAYRAIKQLLPSFRGRATESDWLIAGGLIVVAVGTLPFVTYFYAPIGAGDRFNFVSSIGGAAVVLGVLLAASRLPWAGLGLTGLFLASALWVRAERAETWAIASADAERIIAAAPVLIPEPDGTLVLGPTPIQRTNIAAFVDRSNVDAAMQLAYGTREVRAEIAKSLEQFESVPASRRLDIRPLSRLEPDVVFGPDGQPRSIDAVRHPLPRQMG